MSNCLTTYSFYKQLDFAGKFRFVTMMHDDYGHQPMVDLINKFIKEKCMFGALIVICENGKKRLRYINHFDQMVDVFPVNIENHGEDIILNCLDYSFSYL